MLLREAEESDAPAVIAFAGDPERSLLEEQLAQVALAAEGGLEVLAEWERVIRAHIVVSGPGGRGGGGEVALFVAPDWRGQGLAQLLLSVAESWARAAGIAALWLDVDSANAAAIALYERCGFADEGPAGDGVLRMRMPL